MTELKDSIEALRLELLDKHSHDLALINSLAAEQTAYQTEVARALESLLATHAKCSPLIEQLVITVASRLGLGRATLPSQPGIIEYARPDLRLELEQAFHGGNRPDWKPN